MVFVGVLRQDHLCCTMRFPISACQVSVSEILHRTLIAGIGERSAGDATPSTDIPTLGSIFSVVKKVSAS